MENVNDDELRDRRQASRAVELSHLAQRPVDAATLVRRQELVHMLVTQTPVQDVLMHAVFDGIRDALDDTLATCNVVRFSPLRGAVGHH